jgi:hypothetical protein
MIAPEETDLSPFTPDLVQTSGKVLEFLGQVQKLPGFDTTDSVEALMKNYLCFLLLQEDTPGEELIPSEPIQAVWFSHMLQSCAYKEFVTTFQNILRLSHPVTRTLDPQSRIALETRTQKLMEERYPSGYDLNANSLFIEKWNLLTPAITPEMVINDRDWILEFNKFTKGTDIKSVEFRKKALFGYRRFIYLKGRYSSVVEKIGLSPCPSIDLIWHTHLVHPAIYTNDLLNVLGHVPMHKLLALEDRTEAFMDTRDDQSMDLWQREFKESIFVYAVV